MEADFERVPRHPFVPRIFISPANDGWYEPLDESIDRDRWLRAVYTDDVCVTQLNGNFSAWERAVAVGKVRGRATCSSTQPSLMATMFGALDMHQGHRVLEVGTGTGYNAALLCERLGFDQVTTVDIDGSLVGTATAALRNLGYAPTVAAVDGAEGYPAGAPYDRVIATCSFPRIPNSWVEQAREGAVIVVNLFRSLGGGILVRLKVAGHGTAQGRFLPDTGGFMPTRKATAPDAFQLFQHASGAGESRSTTMDPESLRNPELRFFVALTCHDVTELWTLPEDKPEEYWLLTPDGSWARHTIDTAGTRWVEQSGGRRIWDETERAVMEWRDLKEPERRRFGFTITPVAQELWLDDPGNAIRSIAQPDA